jgi:HNH endonuclease
MSINTKDIKKLWGLAAGRCSRPGCDEECIRFLADDPTVIGEMAHVIAKSPKGPRGVQQGGEDTYDNLILLCPNHHSEIDKAPAGTFPPDTLRDWKKQHEREVAAAFVSPVFSTTKEGRTALSLQRRSLIR